MSAELYYTPPSDEVFEEIKEGCTMIWGTFDDTYGYATGKIARIKDLQNVQDNAMYMVAMFDYQRQEILSRIVSEEARKAISDRMIDGGQPDQLNPFL